jgi:hypothetical protein
MTPSVALKVLDDLPEDVRRALPADEERAVAVVMELAHSVHRMTWRSALAQVKSDPTVPRRLR